ncbi:MAG: NAD(+)/NADH kinase [Candidatus Aenigmarchaeota archaeon]|nr:NAD(+)/NADH kinase [Candidatus Aenigmarchaeota archaeon]
MKIALFSKANEVLKERIEYYEFQYSEKKPDIVISLGGDGTYLRSERKFPGIPKLIVRDKNISKKCESNKLEKVLKKLQKKGYKIRKNIKLETKIRRKKITCVNEFSIRNRYATTALRFYVWVNGKRTDEIIADGAIIATPFGSSGYYKSIGGKKFNKGIGVGFNNPTRKIKQLVASERTKIEIKVIRGDAVFSSDNDPQVVLLRKNEVIKIWKSKDVASLVDI